MAITLRGVVANPSDNGTLYDSTERNIDPTSLSCVTGDLIRLVIHRRGLADIVMNKTGGQTWTAGTLRQTGSSSAKVFWCRFNGTWDGANLPSITSLATANLAIQLYLEAWIPTSGSNTWAIDVAESYHAVSAPVSPGDVTATGRTTVASNTVTIADFLSLGLNTWSGQSAGWANPSGAQYRDNDSNTFKYLSLSSLYKILTAAGATGSPVNREGGTLSAGMWIINTFKEQASGPTISSVSDGMLHNGETGIHVLGASFGASHTGSADVIIAAANNVADASAVTQSISSWSVTDILLNAISLSSFTYFSTLYVFVKDSSGNVSAAFTVQREAWVSAAGVLKNLAGTAQTSLTNVRWRMTATTLNGTLVGSSNTGTSDGSGNFSTGNIVLADTSVLNANTSDPVWVSAGVDGGSLATSYSFVGKVTPTYT